jgi:hypothetical protein
VRWVGGGGGVVYRGLWIRERDEYMNEGHGEIGVSMALVAHNLYGGATIPVVHWEGKLMWGMRDVWTTRDG